MHVNAKDGRVRGLDELPELLRNAGELDLGLLALRDVLPDTDHAINLAADVTPSGGVQKHLQALALLGVKRKLEVLRLPPAEGIVQHPLHRLPVVRGDEILHQMAAYRLVLGVAHD